jgi:glycosyltransferase involved in cell wall biosynthesis
MPKAQVAVVAGAGHLGGAERSLVSLIRTASPALRFTVILPDHGDLEAAVSEAGADAHVLPWPRALLTLGELSGRPGALALGSAIPAMRKTAHDLRELLRLARPDALVTNGVKPHALGALAARTLPGLPLVWYLRESLERRRLSRAVLRALSGRCDAAIAISRYVAEDAATYLPRTTQPTVIYNIVGVPVGQSDEARPVPKPEGEVWFASIGGLTALKGHDVFLQAAARVTRDHPEARFLIVGGNRYVSEQHLHYEANLRRLVHELGLGGVVRFLGHRSDVPALLRRVDVLVQSNTAPEGFGRSVVEAMTEGVPVIASGAWSFLELIEDERTGWLVPPGDVPALAARMTACLRSPDTRRETGARARASVSRLVDPPASAATFEATVHAVIARRAASPAFA